MYKVMIVDDEKYVRKGLIYQVPWVDLELELVCEAENGEEGVEKNKLFKPDIIIADIRMPILGGLEMIEIIRKEYASVKFIVTSGYDEFAYIKNALQMSVSNYLLKPVDEEEMRISLESVIFQIKEDELQTQELSSLRDSKIVYELQSVKKDWNKIQNEIQKLSQNVLLILVSSDLKYATNEVQLCNLEELWKKFNGTQGCAFYFTQFKNQIGILLHSNNISQLHFENQDIVKKISGFWGNVVPANMKFYCYHTMVEKEEFVFRYKTILSLFKIRCLQEVKNYDSKIIYNHVDVEFREKVNFYIELFAKKLKERQCVEAINAVNLIFDNKRIYYYNEELLTMSVLEVGIILKKIFTGSSCENEELEDEINLLQRSDIIMLINQMEEIRDYIIDITKKVGEELVDSESQNTIDGILSYINDNITNPELSLTMISEEFYISANYLSQLFKNKVNDNISKHIENKRILLAMELMRMKDASVLTVANGVGFSDPNYFAKVFKKVTGMTPSQYRKNTKE
ncbi:MAG: response regulator [Eubacteriales bacterium]